MQPVESKEEDDGSLPHPTDAPENPLEKKMKDELQVQLQAMADLAETKDQAYAEQLIRFLGARTLNPWAYLAWRRLRATASYVAHRGAAMLISMKLVPGAEAGETHLGGVIGSQIMKVELVRLDFEDQPFELLGRLQFIKSRAKGGKTELPAEFRPESPEPEPSQPKAAAAKPGPLLRPFVEGACIDLPFELVREVLASRVNDVNFAEEDDIGNQMAKLIVELVKRAHADPSQRNICCDAMKTLHAFTPAGQWEKIAEAAATRRMFDAAAARIRKVATSGREKELGVDMVTALSTLVLHYDADCEALGRAELLRHLRTIKPLANARPMQLPPEPKKAKPAQLERQPTPHITLAAVAEALKTIKKGEKVSDALVRAVFAKLAGEPNQNSYAFAARKLWEYSRAEPPSEASSGSGAGVDETAEARKKLAQAIGAAYEAGRAKFLPAGAGAW